MNDFLARTQEGAAALRRAVSDISAQPQLIASVREDPAVGAGILAGVIAQVEKARTLTRPSALGVAALTANHAAYAWSLYRRGARNDALGWGLRAAAWGAGVAATRSQPTSAAVAVGGAAVLATSALAGDPVLRTDAGKGMSHGANVLVAAEALTALRAALKQRKHKARLVCTAETGALVIGHLLLIDGLSRTRAR
ncbi:hypothetical protein QP943_06125 [Corynebacterium kefirresidentii]|uniref:hypothetical protein n=1 Tax=Corynebacterium TaxID=1716 RepID=UPI0003B8C8E5|nr:MULTISPECIES: hypothetical protein [Corynebacterium]ECQ5354113.1 hypothetical protein [Campylobacter jejuni]WKS52545.1 hypothetical protein NLL48_06160 [Corynebacterium tuberculostearicum]ERS48667.1 hypothetical protein HMPREF1282_00619 [Corynebacterium sp. KPL1856]ERS49197.1 hypothetical protein HMPREF1286_00637 [Corynebacterium sp. KPL1860]ERS53876.1 hypothetical protein HMPREF1264_01482 [Corynebacterium sp. KPL1821]